VVTKELLIGGRFPNQEIKRYQTPTQAGNTEQGTENKQQETRNKKQEIENKKLKTSDQ
jgi:hypothetical protein